jgi:hypothetical protein
MDGSRIDFPRHQTSPSRSYHLGKASPQEALTGDDRIDLDEVLPGFELTVNQLFASLALD